MTTRRPARASAIVRRSNLLRTHLLETITESTISAVIEKLNDAALKGNTPAMKLLLEFAVGRPAQARDVSISERERPPFNWGEFSSFVMGALHKYPEAKIELGHALDVLARNRDAREGARPGAADGGPGP
jgi:hypothetical protein